jgi:ABC-type phosphate transport system auxiliary subunit
VILLEFIQKCWKGVLTVAGVIAIVTTMTTFYSSLVTTSELNAAVDGINKSIELRDNLRRLDNVTDSLMKSRIQQRQYPKDKDIAADIEALKIEKEKLQKAVEKK